MGPTPIRCDTKNAILGCFHRWCARLHSLPDHPMERRVHGEGGLDVVGVDPGGLARCGFRSQAKGSLPLQTLSNLLAALREGDYSIRGSGARIDDALGDVTREINALADTLRWQRLDAIEATALLQKIIEEIDVAILSFDEDQKTAPGQPGRERLLNRPWERLLGANAAELGLAHCLEGDTPRLVEFGLPGGRGRWEIRRTNFRQGGLPHQLLVLSDLSRDTPRRRTAHLAADRPRSGPRAEQLPDPNQLDLQQPDEPARARSVAGGLGRRRAAWTLGDLVAIRFPDPFRRILFQARAPASAQTRRGRRGYPGTSCRRPGDTAACQSHTGSADNDRSRRRTVRAAPHQPGAECSRRVSRNRRRGTNRWSRSGKHLDIWVEDEGPGLPNTANLFVPFFTTKKGGSGIGLVLSRQIAEAHQGILTLENRGEGQGCAARLRLPLWADSWKN